MLILKNNSFCSINTHHQYFWLSCNVLHNEHSLVSIVFIKITIILYYEIMKMHVPINY